MRRVLAVVVFVVLVVALVWWLAARGSGPKVDTAAVDTSTSTTPELTGALSPPATDSTWEFDDDNAEVTGDLTGSSSDTAADSGTSGTSSESTTTESQSTESQTTAAPTTGTSASISKAEEGASQAKTSQAQISTGGTSTSKTSHGTASTTEKSPSNAPTKKTSATKTSTTRKTSTAPPKPSYDKHGRLICADHDLALTAGSRSAAYPVGAQPVLTLTVTNTGVKPCVRDLSGSLQVFTVYTADGDRVWSTDDCFPGTGTEIRRLSAGASWTYPVTWAGTTSDPGCQTPRTTVAPGRYQVVAAVGKLSSKPGTFTMTQR